MDKEKAELYASLYARAFLIAETAHNGGNDMNEKPFRLLAEYASKLLNDIDEMAYRDLSPEGWKHYQEETEPHNRMSYECYE